MTFSDFTAILVIISIPVIGVILSLPWWGVLAVILAAPFLIVPIWFALAAIAPDAEESE